MYQLFADGACLGNPGVGGFAFILRDKDGHEDVKAGAVADTTNNRMELTAIIEGLKLLPPGSRVKVTTDSQYVTKGATEWLRSWKARGWKTADKKPVKNQDLWELIDQALGQLTISWEWVQGHAGHVENERCDELARGEAERLAEEISLTSPF